MSPLRISKARFHSSCKKRLDSIAHAKRRPLFPCIAIVEVKLVAAFVRAAQMPEDRTQRGVGWREATVTRTTYLQRPAKQLHQVFFDTCGAYDAVLHGGGDDVVSSFAG